MQIAETRREAPKFAKAAFQENEGALPLPVGQSALAADNVIPEKGPPRTTAAWLFRATEFANVSSTITAYFCFPMKGQE